MKKAWAVLAILFLQACGASLEVRPEDQAAWVGVRVAELEKHPVFITMPVVKTQASDGTEIRNYVNGRNISACSGGGSVFVGTIDFASYNNFASCMSRFFACNNIFHIRDGAVESYTPIGSGGARCFTDARLRPGFRGSTNIF